MNPKRSPSLWWLVLAPFLFLGGVGGGTAILIRQILHLPPGHTFLVPSVQTIEVTEPGTYLLWNNNRTVFEGKAYNKEPYLPDQAIIRLESGEQEIPTQRSWGASTTSDQSQKVEIGRYALDTLGTYTLNVSGFTEEHVFSFGRYALQEVVTAAIACLVLNLLGWFGTPIFIALIFILRSRFPVTNPHNQEIPDKTN